MEMRWGFSLVVRSLGDSSLGKKKEGMLGDSSLVVGRIGSEIEQELPFSEMRTVA